MIGQSPSFQALMALALLLSSCEKKDEAATEGETMSPRRERSRSEIPAEESGVISTGDPATEYDPSLDYKNTKGLAMDRSPVDQKALTTPPPAWLSIGPDIHPDVTEGSSAEIDWRIDKPFNYPKAPSRISIDGEITLGNKARWSRGILSPNHKKALLVPMVYREGFNVFDVADQKIEEKSGQAIPSVNYDDPRRWYIGWKQFLSESTIIGTVNEEDFSGHITVRTSIYTYDLQTKTLSRVKIPDAIQQLINDGVYIKGVSGSSILVSSNHGDYTITLK